MPPEFIEFNKMLENCNVCFVDFLFRQGYNIPSNFRKKQEEVYVEIHRQTNDDSLHCCGPLPCHRGDRICRD